jgi:hypothetical protein
MPSGIKTNNKKEDNILWMPPGGFEPPALCYYLVISISCRFGRVAAMAHDSVFHRALNCSKDMWQNLVQRKKEKRCRKDIPCHRKDSNLRIPPLLAFPQNHYSGAASKATTAYLAG